MTSPATETKPESDSPGITDRQMKMLNTLLGHAGITERDEALTWCGGVLGVDLASRKDLTTSQASELIDRLLDGEAHRMENRTDVAPQVPVQEAIRRVMRDIGQIGVGKGGYNQQQNYRFRGIDQFVDSLSPILSKHGVIMLPEVGEPRITEHPTSKGGIQFMVVIRVTWTIVGPMGDEQRAVTLGQALDSSDKAGNKAMSAAFKYALGQVFSVPNIGWAEQDNDHPTVEHEQFDNTELITKIEGFAAEEGLTFADFTRKVRSDNGAMTVEAFKAAHPDLLRGYVARIERYREKQRQEAEAAREVEPQPDAPGPSS